MEIQEIAIPTICLEWSDWKPWNDFKIDVRQGGVRIPKHPGVYEVKYMDSDERLTIGKTSDLNYRVKQALVKGQFPHSTGERIRESEDVEKLLIRWAVTDRPAAVEEELYRLYQEEYGRLPKYTISTR